MVGRTRSAAASVAWVDGGRTMALSFVFVETRPQGSLAESKTRGPFLPESFALGDYRRDQRRGWCFWAIAICLERVFGCQTSAGTDNGNGKRWAPGRGEKNLKPAPAAIENGPRQIDQVQSQLGVECALAPAFGINSAPSIAICEASAIRHASGPNYPLARARRGAAPSASYRSSSALAPDQNSVQNSASSFGGVRVGDDFWMVRPDQTTMNHQQEFTTIFTLIVARATSAN